jgi:hypothetical protein
MWCQVMVMPCTQGIGRQREGCRPRLHMLRKPSSWCLEVKGVLKHSGQCGLGHAELAGDSGGQGDLWEGNTGRMAKSAELMT